MKLFTYVGFRMLFAVSMALLAISLPVAGQKQKLGAREWLSKQAGRVSVTSDIQSQTLTAKGDIELLVEVTVTNVQAGPLVFCRKCIDQAAVFIARDQESLFNNRFAYDQDSFGFGDKYVIKDPQPDKDPFILIRKGESFTFVTNLKLFSRDQKTPPIGNGKYVFLQTILTWSDDGDLGKELTERWKTFGFDLWTSNLITEPVPLVISH